MRFLSFLISSIAVLGTGWAQTYPTRPITLVVPFAAGGPVDVVARILQEPMRRSLGQAVVVENTVGAGGSVGVGRVARAAPVEGDPRDERCRHRKRRQAPSNRGAHGARVPRAGPKAPHRNS